MCPPRIRHCRLLHSPKHPGTDAGEDLHHQNPHKCTVEHAHKVLFPPVTTPNMRNLSCTGWSEHICTKPACTCIYTHHVDVAAGWAEGNHSLTPVRSPFLESVPHSTSWLYWWRVAHLPSNSPKCHVFFFFCFESMLLIKGVLSCLVIQWFFVCTCVTWLFACILWFVTFLPHSLINAQFFLFVLEIPFSLSANSPFSHRGGLPRIMKVPTGIRLISFGHLCYWCSCLSDRRISPGSLNTISVVLLGLRTSNHNYV
jgi:hypothetical protein